MICVLELDLISKMVVDNWMFCKWLLSIMKKLLNFEVVFKFVYVGFEWKFLLKFFIYIVLILR